MDAIAHIHTDFSGKFGIPRQSGLVESLTGTIVFEAAYRTGEALRGLDGFSHLWLIWAFSAITKDTWSPTVRPPRLGGNERCGVFASRSPFRPNPIGLSAVRLEGITLHSAQGPLLHVSGIDLMDNTPIYDIKPYIPYADCLPMATGGFAKEKPIPSLKVVFPNELLELIPNAKQQALMDVLAHDPRPSYQNDPHKVYGFEFAGFTVKFQVESDCLTVIMVFPAVEKA